MRKGISYADAVKLLGQESKLAKVLTGTLVGAVPGLSLLDVKDEAVRLAGEATGKLHDRVTGLNRYDRTARLEAAHAVLLVAAFFEALGELSLPFDAKELRLDRDEQAALSGAGPQGSFVHTLMRIEPAGLRANQSYAVMLDSITEYYRKLATALIGFVSGLVVRDRLNTTEWERAKTTIDEDLPEAARRKYEELHRRLALDIPEFALWQDMISRQRVETGLAELEALLIQVAAQTRASDHRHTLSRAHRAVLDRPIAQSGEVPSGMRMPTLAEAYVNPDFRLAEYGEQADPSAEWWWDKVEPSDDIAGFLARYFTSPDATRMPLVVLGQPGAGKSVLTKIMAGRLPDGDFLPVRVPLREVPADGTIQEQIEAAVREATGERLSWPELTRSADGALPVVMLDGLDELLQATGIHRSDYLSRVADFQRREAELGRPAVVLVTTRTAVADRMRFPPGCLAIRLEPFKEEQVRRWLAVWNAANRDYFTARGLEPLPPETALAQGQLASQPLLLLMLALYDADANALQRGETGLGQAELYERLLTRFARREVDKHHSGLPDSQAAHAVETELRTLSVAAFAMFNRGRQWVMTQDLDDDLAALLPAPPARTTSFQAPLSRADRVIGKFFFVHQASAVRDDASLRTYEFLHATFGEYLVARMVRDVLRSMVARETAAGHDPFFGRPQPDDGLLHALLSFSLLTERQPTVEFLRDLLPALDREPATDLLVRLLHNAETRTDQSYADYRPGRNTFITRCAHYTANLVILASLVAGGITADRLFPGDRRPVRSWPHLTSLWYARLSGKAFESLVRHFQVERTSRHGTHNLVVRYIGHAEYRRVGGFEPGWDEDGPLPDSHTLDMVHFLGDRELDGLASAAEPAIMAADLRSAAQLFSYSEEAVEHLADAWRLTARMRETIEAITADLRGEYRNDPGKVAAAYRRATGSELPAEVTGGAVADPDRSDGAQPGRNVP
ncbi:NACHT domain-containing protein [Microbispora bryophytorum]|uniref:NACHT domain-containing protein n=1 Tax=Microbispora bryophytorum TaxID=1460882 RepID=UPI0033FE38EA